MIGGDPAGPASPPRPAIPSRAITDLSHIPIGPQRAPRGAELSCKTWGAEAAMRMLMNNLDPEVAEDPENLIV